MLFYLIFTLVLPHVRLIEQYRNESNTQMTGSRSVIVNNYRHSLVPLFDQINRNNRNVQIDRINKIDKTKYFNETLEEYVNSPHYIKVISFKHDTHRNKRESSPLISTFDISKMFKKKKFKSKEGKPEEVPQPSMASLKSGRLVFVSSTTESGVTTSRNQKANLTNAEVTAESQIDLRSAATSATQIIADNRDTPNILQKATALANSPTDSSKVSIQTQKQDLNMTELKPIQIRLRNEDTRPANKANTSKRKKTKSRKPNQNSRAETQNEQPRNATERTPSKPKLKTRKAKNLSTSPGSLSLVSSAKRELRVVGKKKENETAWPVKHAAVVEGDIILGGLMMVHSRSEVATCGPVMAQGGVQALEAMLFALDATADLAPPRVKIGAHVLDDCDNDTYGLEMALDFIKGSISNIDDAEYACNATAVRKVISGVVGAASSVTSVQVANLLRLFKIPQVSFFSTSPELSNKARFEYFTRTIPSDLHQVRAMVEIVRKLGWKYVSIIYEESNYGIKAFEELETLLARNGICIAVKERLVKDSGEADSRAYDAIVQHLLSRPRARGVIVFGSDQEVAGVMAAVGRAGAANAFRWVGSDGWSARTLVSDGNEAAVEGTISVQPQANQVKGFKEYFLKLTVENNLRNPWFIEFWEDHFRCRYPGSPRTPYNGNYSRTCSGRERLTANNTQFEAQLQFVVDAVTAFTYAIRDMHMDLCGGKPGLCEAMRPASGATLLRYLRQVRFVGLTGDEFHFDSAGDGPARYNILHFKQAARGLYRWVKVGQYLDGELQLDMDEIQFKWGETQPPESVCSAECELGQAKQYVEGESCCWHCFNCTQYEIRSPEVETACVECPRGTLPDATRIKCAALPEIYLRPDSAWAIGAMTFSSLGILLTTFVASVWVARGDTPVVRASGKELSFVLLAGIMMCYLVTFALVFRPTDFLCTMQRFGTGFCFTVVYAALLTKTNRISRIFNASKQSARRPSLISPKSQLVICTILVSIQVVIVVVWQIVSPARAIQHHPSREDNVLVCASLVDASYTIAFFYPILLILVCTVYAVLTRKIPEAFNESKHIGFTMYTTCVIWLAFVPLYFGTAAHVPLRVTSMAVTISLSASVTLVCLFSPKLYIILVRPERNVRASLMPQRWVGAGSRGAAGPGGGKGAAGGAVCAALVGAAPLPRAPPDPTPSTDRSTLYDTEKITSSDKYIQTENGIGLIQKNNENETNHIDVSVPLNAKRLLDIDSGLPSFDASDGKKGRAVNGPPGVTVIGSEIAL